MKMDDRSSRSLFQVLLILGCFLLLPAAPTSAGTSDWPMVGCNPAHTGWNSDETELYPPLPVELIYPVGPALAGLSTSGDRLFTTCRSDTNTIRVLDIGTGTVLWSFLIPDSRGSANHTPALWDTLVFAGGQQGDGIHCLNTNTGDEVWSQPIGSLYMSHATIDDGKIFINRYGDSLYCFDGLTGNQLWSKETLATSVVPAIVGDTLFAAVRRDSLLAVDKENGNLFWGVQIPVARCVLVAGDSLLYLKSDDVVVKALRRADGSEKWSRSLPGEDISDIDRGAMAYMSHTLYVSSWTDSSGYGTIHALDGDTGEDVWVYTFDSLGALNPVIANGVVYVGSWGDRTLHALEAPTGNLITSFPGIGEDYIVSNGSLIATDSDGNVHILRMEPLGVDEGGRAGPLLPRSIVLEQNAPNPFNPLTTILYRVAGGLGEDVQVLLDVFDVQGRKVKTLVDAAHTAGSHSVQWDGRSDRGVKTVAGVYFYRMKAGGHQEIRRMVLVE